MKTIVAVAVAVVLVGVSSVVGYMVIKSAMTASAAVPVVAKPKATEEAKVIIEVAKPVAAKLKTKTPPVELKFPEATKLAIALLKKDADAEWAEEGRKLATQERVGLTPWLGNDGVIPPGHIHLALQFQLATRLRDSGLPKSALYAVGSCALNDFTTNPLFEIVWAKKPSFRSVDQLAAAASRVSFMSESFALPTRIISSGNFYPNTLTGEWRRDIEYVFGVDASMFVR